MTTIPRRRGLLLVAGAAALVLTGCGAPAPAPATGAAPPAASASTASATPSTAPRGPRPLPAAKAVTVRSVSVGSIDLRTSRLEELALLEDGSLAAPEDPDRAGWYAGGTVPGAVGPAVIAGHVDSTTGPAVFADLSRVEPGAEVTIGLSDGTSTRFVVDRVITTPKKGFPTAQVFGPTPDAQLRLITCGGPYDRSVGSYVDNTVVFATALG